MTQTTVLRLFKSNQLSSHYIFTNGDRATFVNGKFATDDPAKIAELESEVKRRHPHIYIDKNEHEVESDYLDPMAALRKRFFAEFQEQLKSVEGRKTDSGASVQGPLNATSTADIAAVTIGVAGAASKSAGTK